MGKFRVSFSGFAFVEADSAEEAEELFYDDMEVLSEYEVEEVQEVEDFKVVW